MKKVNIYYNLHSKSVQIYELSKNYYENNQSALILANTQEQAEQLNKFLWSREKLYFLPHCVIEHELAEVTPIVIALDYPAEDHPIAKQNRPVINLKDSIQDYLHLINSEIIELIGTDIQERDEGRERVKQYKESGWHVEFFG